MWGASPLATCLTVRRAKVDSKSEMGQLSPAPDHGEKCRPSRQSVPCRPGATWASILGAGQGGPNIPSAKGSAKFWVKDGVLTKMEIKVDGSMEFNGNEMEIVRTTTTEIKDIGTTKIEIPEGASAKLK